MLTGRGTVNHVMTVLPGVPPVEHKGLPETVDAASKIDNSVLLPLTLLDGAHRVTRPLQGAKGPRLGSR